MNLGLSIYSVQNPNGIWNHLKDKEFLYVELYALNSSEEKVLEDLFDILNLFLKIKIKELELVSKNNLPDLYKKISYFTNTIKFIIWLVGSGSYRL